MAFGHIALGQTDNLGRDVIGDGQLVILDIALALVLEDVDGQSLGGLLERDFLEIGGQLLVFLDVLGIAVDGGGDEHLHHVLLNQALEAGNNARQQRLLVLDTMEVLNHQQRVRQASQRVGHLLESVLNLALVAHALAQHNQVKLIGLQVVQR